MGKVYKENEVFKHTLKYFGGDELATNVWISKYALRNSKGELLERTPVDMFGRITDEIHRIEQKFPEPLERHIIYGLFEDFRNLIPAGSILYGIGNDYTYSSLGNCFTIGEEHDSYGGIFLRDQEQVQLMKRRAGVGHDITHYRPKGSYVSNAAKSSTGPVSFMDRFSNSTREVAQDGRRGALMLTMGVDHEDIEDFITAKDDTTKITGANISVRITDDFMKKVREGDEKATRIWNKIVHQAWKTAEPGVLFWDTILRESPSDCYSEDGFKTVSTNPCSELPLSAYDSCRLLSINLTNFVRNPFTKEAQFDFAKLYATASMGQRIMDDIVELEVEKIEKIIRKIENDSEPEHVKNVERRVWEKILENLLKGRRTGLSGIGLGDVFAQLGLKYGECPSIKLATEIYKTIAKASYRTSVYLAKYRGNFPIWDLDKERNNPFIRRVMTELGEDVHKTYIQYGRRNIANLTIPPSGSLAILAQISSGIEPVFAISYKRRRKIDSGNVVFIDKNGDKWEEYRVFHPKFLEWYLTIAEGISTPDEAKNTLNSANSETLEAIIARSPYHGSTASEINYLYKVELQGAIQKWVDHSISVTTNLPKETSEKVVGTLYEIAWKTGCKGFTIYREGSRDGVLISNKTNESAKFEQHSAPKRPRVLRAEATSATVKGDKFTVVVGLLDDKPYEVFAYKGNGISGPGELIKQRKGDYVFKSATSEEQVTDDLSDEQEAITRILSYGLRHGGDVTFAVEQLNKTKGDLTNFAKAIARVLKRYIINGKTARSKCEQCGNDLHYEDGCPTCKSCGWSKC